MQTDLKKLEELIDRGLCSGMGTVNGSMCIEAAIAIASGEELNDSPRCVHRYVRRFSIRLNDAWWPSDAERAAGLKRFALAQLGSASWSNEQARGWVRAIVLRTIREVLPIYLRAAKLETASLECEAATDIPTALVAARKAKSAAAAAYAYADADAAAYAAAAAAAYAYADAYADAAAAAYAAAAYAAAYAAAAYAAAAAYDAAAYADAADARGHALKLAANIAAEECERISQ